MTRFRSTYRILVLMLSMLAADGLAQGEPGANLYEQYGAGFPALDGFLPAIDVNSNPVIGNGDFTILGSVPEGAATALLGLSTAPGQVPLGHGAILLVDPASLQIQPMQIVGDRAEKALPLPGIPSLVGLQLYCQVAVPAASATGYALSAGLRIELSAAEDEYGIVATLTGTPGNLTPSYHHRQGGHIETTLPASLSLQSIDLASPIDDRGMTRDARRYKVELDRDNPAAPAIQLQDLGRLYRFQDNASGELGFLVAYEDAALMAPVLSSSLGTGDQYAETVGIDDSGRWLAALVNDAAGDRVRLVSLSGRPLMGSVPVADVSPSTATDVDPKTLLFLGDRLVALGTDIASSQPVLLTAPADGSAPLTPVALPLLGVGTPAANVDHQVMMAGNRLVGRAGAPPPG